jgi:hypothetical protein
MAYIQEVKGEWFPDRQTKRKGFQMSESTNGASPNTTIESYGHSIDLASLPYSSQVALMRRGVAHYLGNEQASKVSGWVEKQPGEVTDVDKAAVKAEYIREAVQAMIAGTMGHGRVGVARGTALETVMRRIAETEVKAILKANKLAWPSGEKTVTLGDATFTGRQLVERRLAQHGDRIKTLAEKEQKALERMAAATAGEGAAALGL